MALQKPATRTLGALNSQGAQAVAEKHSERDKGRNKLMACVEQQGWGQCPSSLHCWDVSRQYEDAQRQQA